MKKFQKIVGMAALSAAVLSSCVKNEESDGVKSLREAQAGLIDAQAEGILADVQYTLEEVNGLKYTNLSKKWVAKQDSLNMIIKEIGAAVTQASSEAQVASYQATIANLNRQQELLAKQHEIDLLEAAADLEKAKSLIEEARLNLANSQDDIMMEYLSQYDYLLGQIQNIQEDINFNQYVLDIWDTVSEEYQITSYERSIKFTEISQKYTQLQLDNVKAAQTAYLSAVATPSTAANALATAIANKTVAQSLMENKEVERDAAFTTKDLKSKEYDDAMTARGDMEQKIFILSADGNATSYINGIFYRSIYGLTTDIQSNTDDINSANLAIISSNEQLAYFNAAVNSWTSKSSSLKTTYDTKKAAYNTAYQALSTAQVNYNAAVEANNTYGTTATQDALTAAQTALNTAIDNYTTANTEYQDAEYLYTDAQDALANAKYNVNYYTAAITDANASIASLTNENTVLAAQKTAAEAELLTLKADLTAAVTAEEAARVAYNSAYEAYYILDAEYDTYYSNFWNLNSLAQDLENLANGIKYDAFDYEQSISSLEAQLESSANQIATYTEYIADINSGVVRDEADNAALVAYIAGLNYQKTQYQDELTRYAGLIEAYKTEIASAQ